MKNNFKKQLKKGVRSRLGCRHSEETKRKIGLANSIALKGKKLSKGHKIKISKGTKGKNIWMKGKKHSEKTKIKMSLSHKGKIPHLFTKETRKKMSIAQKARIDLLGKKLSKEHRLKISQSLRGVPVLKRRAKNAYNWKGGITPKNVKIRNSIEYKLFIDSVFARDGYTCQKYRIKGIKLNVHHIQNFAQYPEFRFDVNNGVTLSEKAHQEFHKKYGKINNTKEQLEEFLLKIK